MFARPYRDAALAAALLTAAVEVSFHAALNAPVLRPPVGLTVAGVALVSAAFAAVLFWMYAAVLRAAMKKSRERMLPVAAAYAAVLAPPTWFAAYHILPRARLSWAAALAIGLVIAPFAAAGLAAAFRRRRLRLGVVILGAAVLAVAVGRNLMRSTKPAADNRANFLLITLDTTRADRLGCYGHAGARTPNLDRLAARGVRFKRCLAQEPLTAPSHAVIFTSLYPAATGVVLNGMKLRPDVPTLAGEFRAAGYRTAACVASSSVHARDTALNRGFDYYDDAVTPAEGYHGTPLAPLAVARRFSMLARDDNDAERPAAAVTDAGIRWLARHKQQPFFLWLHYFDAHDDYLPPDEFAPKRTGGFFYRHRLNHLWGEDARGKDLRELILALYDGELAYTDAEVGRFLGALRDAGVYERTVVVIVGDHGEAFEEHGTKFHGFRLYDEELAVPFIVCDLGGNLPALAGRPALVSTLDVAPTVLNLAGLPVPPDMGGTALFSSRPPAGGVYSVVIPEPLRESRFSAGGFEAYSTPAEKIILGRNGGVEYYNLVDDPAEKVNLAATSPERVALLRAELKAVRATVEAAPPSSLVRDEETIKKLRTLGYIQ